MLSIPFPSIFQFTKLEEKQDRKDQYVAETDFFQTFRVFFTMKLQREIDVMLGAINKVIPELSEMALAEERCN